MLNTHTSLKMKTLPTNNDQFMTEALQKVTMTRSKLKHLSYYKINTRITTKSNGISELPY